MEFIGFQKIPRYSRECIITEKIDGTNGQIFIPPEAESLPYPHFLVGCRTRWITPETDNFGFAKWAYENAEELIKLGPGRHFGEWWGQGINRGYGIKEKRFSLFNIKKWSDDLVRPKCCHVVPVIKQNILFESSWVEWALEWLKEHGSCAAPGFMKPEGVVIYHIAGNILFKKTLEGDEESKGGRVNGVHSHNCYCGGSCEYSSFSGD